LSHLLGGEDEGLFDDVSVAELSDCDARHVGSWVL
jgi:hypothetical protein